MKALEKGRVQRKKIVEKIRLQFRKQPYLM
jgi:hypothetical protein